MDCRSGAFCLQASICLKLQGLEVDGLACARTVPTAIPPILEELAPTALHVCRNYAKA